MNTEPMPGAADSDEPVLTLIKKIKDNKLDPALLSAEDRRRCVEVLWGEGYSVADIAQILKVGERTIFRDRQQLRSLHALHVDAQFAPQMAGDLMRQAECSISRLRRMAKESGASVMERAMAESFAFKAFLDTLTKLQSMGYLLRVPTGVVAQVVGASSGQIIATYDQLAQRLEELDGVDQEIGPSDPRHLEERRKLKELVERGRLAVQVECLVQRPGEN